MAFVFVQESPALLVPLSSREGKGKHFTRMTKTFFNFGLETTLAASSNNELKLKYPFVYTDTSKA